MEEGASEPKKIVMCPYLDRSRAHSIYVTDSVIWTLFFFLFLKWNNHFFFRNDYLLWKCVYRLVCSPERYMVRLQRKKWHLVRLDSCGYSWCFLRIKEIFSLLRDPLIFCLLCNMIRKIREGEAGLAQDSLVPFWTSIFAWEVCVPWEQWRPLLLAAVGMWTLVLRSSVVADLCYWVHDIFNYRDRSGFVCFWSHDLVLEKIALSVFNCSDQIRISYKSHLFI